MAFIDIKLNKNNDDYYDMIIANGKLEITDGLDSAINISIFCYRRASESEMPAAQYRRGWFGNSFLGFDNYEMGSKLWLLEQARATQLVLNRTVNYAKECLEWMVEDGYLTKVTTDAFYGSNNEINLTANLYRSNNMVDSKGFVIWENTINELGS